MSKTRKLLRDTCPHCSVPIRDGKPGWGIWTGSIKSEATNGPVYGATCTGCGESLIAMPTHEEAETGTFLWELSTEFPGERFVATMAPIGNMRDFLLHINSFIALLNSRGFDARCPAYTFAGILVPKTQADAAREFLKTERFDSMKVWISDDDGCLRRYIGP